MARKFSIERYVLIRFKLASQLLRILECYESVGLKKCFELVEYRLDLLFPIAKAALKCPGEGTIEALERNIVGNWRLIEAYRNKYPKMECDSKELSAAIQKGQRGMTRLGLKAVTVDSPSCASAERSDVG